MHWIFAHLIGDFLFQNDWMAMNKKRSSFVCAVHVLSYLLPFLLTPLALWQIALIGFQHYVQDRTGFVVWFMRKKGSVEFAQQPMAPWSIIVTDNILHIQFMAFVAWIPEFAALYS